MTVEVDLVFPIEAEIDVFYVRQVARQHAERLGFRSAKIYRLATAVSELANNLHFHAYRGGTVRLRCLREPDRAGIEVTVEDQGPGIPDIGVAMQDGYSTNRGLGGGLPGARRLMDEFSIESEVGVGTKIVARLWGP